MIEVSESVYNALYETIQRVKSSPVLEVRVEYSGLRNSDKITHLPFGSEYGDQFSIKLPGKFWVYGHRIQYDGKFSDALEIAGVRHINQGEIASSQRTRFALLAEEISLEREKEKQIVETKKQTADKNKEAEGQRTKDAMLINYLQSIMLNSL
ncbi:MAG: hypothetical protein FWC51_02225 [Proteobacteria bacterium]|nr:hypothetical protein [Pseudomonadota bacterium]